MTAALIAAHERDIADDYVRVDGRDHLEKYGREFDLLLHKTRIDLVAVTREQMEVGREAWRRFGRGHHEANLNFGDCFSYALAAVSGEPLLFKGDDFSKTDIGRVALGRG